MDWQAVPEFVKYMLAVGAGSLGAIVIGFLKYKSDSKRLDVTDRTSFTQNLMDRVQNLEEQVASERRYCDELIAKIREEHRQVREQYNADAIRADNRILQLEKLVEERHRDRK